MMNNELVIDAKPILLNDPGEGFQSRDMIYTIAHRLMAHTKGKIIGGYGKAPNGDILPLQDRYAPGDLIVQDALYAVEYALTRGLNPYGHIHLWYQRSNKAPAPQLIIDIDWKILKGWAEWRNPFRTELVMMDDESRQKYGLKQGDLGALGYNILDSDNQYFHQYQMTFIQKDIVPSQARLLAAQAVAKSVGVGIVLASEMKTSSGKSVPPPKGRSWQWRAEIRAKRDAIRHSHGEPPPAQIRRFAASEGIAINEKHLSLMAAESFPTDLPPDEQNRYLELEDRTNQVRQTPKHDLSAVNDLMRNNGDDDPLELSPEDDPNPVEDETSQVPPELAELRQALADEAAANPRQGDASEERMAFIRSKLEEIFTGKDSLANCNKVLGWLFGDSPGLTFGQSQALCKRLLLKQNEETGEYPIRKEFAETLKAVLVQAE